MKPPRSVDRWARRLLPPGELGQHILGDLREQYARDVGGRGGPARSRAGAAVRMIAGAIEVRLRVGLRGRSAPARAGFEARPMRATLRTMGYEARIALRSLTRSPGYTSTAVLTMGLGLAAFTSVYSVLHAVLLAPPPFENPDELVAVRVVETSAPDDATESYLPSFPQYRDIRERSRVFDGIAAWTTDAPVMEHGDGTPPVRVEAAAVTGDFFRVIGVSAHLGRTIGPSDQNGDADRVAVLSHALWANRFGADPGVLGRTIPLNGERYVVIGVLDEAFDGLPDIPTLPRTDTDVWLPYATTYLSSGRDVRGLHNILVIARVADGVEPGEVNEDLRRVSADLSAEYEEHVDERAVAVAVQDLIAGDSRTPLRLVFMACTVVLLLALLNVAALTLGRASERSGEMAIRQALGGGRWARLRVLSAEAGWLALGGVMCGAVLSRGFVTGARVAESGLIPRLDRATLDTRSLAVLATSAMLATLVAGLLPSLGAGVGTSRLRSSSTRGATTRGPRLRDALVATQVAGTVVLLASTGLLIRSLAELGRVDPGYDPEGVLLVTVRQPTPFVSPEWPRHVAFFRDLTDRTSELPGVESAAIAYQPPVSPGWSNGFEFADRAPPPPGEGPSAIFRPIGPGYFETIRARIVSGRSIDRSDDVDSRPVAVVNEAFVAAFFDDPTSVVGTRLDYGSFWRADVGPTEIVGVVADVRFNGAEQATAPAIYFPHAQQPVHEMTLVVRTRGEPLALVDPVSRLVAELQPGLPVDATRSLADELRTREGVRRFLAAVLGTLAGIATVLAMVGLYGVLAYSVELRRREIGIRLAVGADATRVVTNILGGSARLVGLGLAGGFALALGATRALSGFMFGVTALDPVTWGLAVSGLVAIALGVSALPARRAARIDPIRTLRDS